MTSINQNTIDFADRLIKGKIVEEIFRQLFQYDKKYTVTPLGYEYKLPELNSHLHKQHRGIIDKISSQLTSAPDYLLLSNSGDQIYLVEVKYRMVLNRDRILEAAKKIHEDWDYSWLFIASPSGFYFQSCKEIIDQNGEIFPLAKKWPSIHPEVMQKYIQILNKYILPREGSDELG